MKNAPGRNDWNEILEEWTHLSLDLDPKKLIKNDETIPSAEKIVKISSMMKSPKTLISI